MIIERIQVEEGFLNGLDLKFNRGLNVLIGPRGSGKTSIVELLRFALDIAAFSSSAQTEARKHALSILGPGRVTVTLLSNGGRVTFTRSAEEESPRQSEPIMVEMPIVFSQREIESIGLDSAGRLRLIDAFHQASPPAARETSLLSYIRSATREIQSLSKEVDDLREQAKQLATIPELLEAAKKEEASFLQSVAEAGGQQEELEKLRAAIAAASVQSSVLERSTKNLKAWRDLIAQALARKPGLEKWPDDQSSRNPLTPIAQLLDSAARGLQGAIAALDKATASVAELAAQAQKSYIEASDEARRARVRLDEIKTGAGEVTRKVAELEQKASQLRATIDLLSTKQANLQALIGERGAYLDEVDRLREDRFEERVRVAQSLKDELGPRIRVDVARFGLHDEYISAIAATLRGSGLHYSTLAPLLAEKLSPREMAEAIEEGDPGTIADVAGIDNSRAQRLISFAKSAGTEEILTSPVEDAIQVSLLDGNEYKPTERLSTGQRCTVILPILLSDRRRILILDQPEDHLDNAFIVETVIKAIILRGPESQLICATHNANIPVLGDASQIILLGSDGRRGFVRYVGPLESPRSISAITNVMEGGWEAFRRRAEFYGKPGVLPNG